MGAAVKLDAGGEAGSIPDFTETAGDQDRPQACVVQRALGFGEGGEFRRQELAGGLLVVRQQAEVRQGQLENLIVGRAQRGGNGIGVVGHLLEFLGGGWG